jgi:ribonuclease P protein component
MRLRTTAPPIFLVTVKPSRFAGRALSGAKRSVRRRIRAPGIDLPPLLHYRRARQRLPYRRPFFFESKGMSDEAHFPAQQPRPQAASRVPQPHGDGRRPQGAERAPRARPQEAQRLVTISKRADFLAANGGRRTTTPGFILLVRDRKDADPAMRVGFTVTKKIGGAVVRNRMKRRFRALAREIMPAKGLAGSDHVMIGRAKGIERDFGLLRDELANALDGLRK